MVQSSTRSSAFTTVIAEAPLEPPLMCTPLMTAVALLVTLIRPAKAGKPPPPVMTVSLRIEIRARASLSRRRMQLLLLGRPCRARSSLHADASALVVGDFVCCFVGAFVGALVCFVGAFVVDCANNIRCVLPAPAACEAVTESATRSAPSCHRMIPRRLVVAASGASRGRLRV